MARGETRPVRSAFSDLFDWFDEGLPPIFGWRSIAGTRGIRIEDLEKDGRYIVRAELPGVDPDKDIEITVSDGVLNIRAERQEQHKDAHRSEFSYGSFTRRLALPAGADEEDVTANYTGGILEVSIGLKEATKPEVKRITVARAE
jgi:HSP20 family molecular chaperone IbpA